MQSYPDAQVLHLIHKKQDLFLVILYKESINENLPKNCEHWASAKITPHRRLYKDEMLKCNILFLS